MGHEISAGKVIGRGVVEQTRYVIPFSQLTVASWVSSQLSLLGEDPAAVRATRPAWLGDAFTELPRCGVRSEGRRD